MEYEIRKYRDSDREAVRRICMDTAILGKPVDILFGDRDIAADAIISYYTDFEPESCFVAAAGGSVIGYLAGSVDSSRRRRMILFRIIPSLFIKAISRPVFFRKKTLLLCKSFIRAFIRGEFFNPGFSRDYPASLHINVEEGFRRYGVGRRLLDEYFNYLERKKIKGVMLETKSGESVRFFAGRGFKVLYCREISYLQNCGCAGAKFFVMGAKLRAVD